MFGRLTRVEHLKAIEGIASDVRQSRAAIISTREFGEDWARSYECLFRLSGTPVALQVSSPIFIEDGEAVRVVGSFNRNGVFEASAYYNRSSGVSGKSYWAWRQLLVITLMTIIIGGVLFFNGLLEYHFSPVFRWLMGIIGLAFALIGWRIFVQWSKIRTIDRLLNDGKPFQP